MILSINMWFQTLMRQFFFNIDKIVYNFISTLYELLISIARTSVLSQADILDMAERVYKLLAVFMIFKVTFSLIMYVVNPDDFTDNSKGIGKLGTNIIISLALLVLTPYVFNYAFRLQTIILEDNSLAVLIFGDEMNSEENPINSAGDDIAYMVMTPFFIPNTSINELFECTELLDPDKTINNDCFGLESDYQPYSENYDSTMYKLTRDGDSENEYFTLTALQNYAAGIENRSLGLAFRQEMATAVTPDDEFVMEYKYVFSTILGVVVILLLLTFCLDVALRSIKLSFLQLIAPIPIISLVDPKSGKDGLFKQWYQMCFKAYISLFVRLLALFFAIYIIDRVDEMVDIVDGTYVSNTYIKVFVIIGVLMFAKQLPQILSGLGIKLDGDGKFNLNPLRKIEQEAIGGQLLKKPNDMISKVGKGIVKAPLSGMNTLGKKTIGGVDAAMSGKGFKQGWNRTHGNLYNNFYKKLDEWAPDSAELRKNTRLARENLHQIDMKAIKGQDVYAKANGDIKNVPFSKDYRDSYAAVDLAKKRMYAANAEKKAKETEVENLLREEKITYLEAQKMFEKINKDAGTAEKRYEVAKARHDEMKKIHVKDAQLEDSFDYYDKIATQEQKEKFKKNI